MYYIGLVLLQGPDKVVAADFLTVVDAQFLIVVCSVPYTIVGEVHHHFLAFLAREECHLSVGFCLYASVLASFIEECQRGFAYGDGLCLTAHNDDGRVYHFHACCRREWCYAISLAS